MKTYCITYQMGGKKFTVKQHGFKKAQDQVAQIMNAGGVVVEIHEGECQEEQK